MRLAVPIALATATAFSVSALPVRAFPGASVNLVKINGEGVKPLPGLQAQPAAARASTELLISQSAADPNAVRGLASGTEDFEIQFNGPLPQFSASDILRVVNRETGDLVEEISLTSGKVSFSADRRTITISHDYTVKDGEIICALFPDGPNPLPRRTSPCCFTVVKAAAVVEPSGGGGFPWWIIPVGALLGLGVCAIAGCFDGGGGGGGGGSNNSSR